MVYRDHVKRLIDLIFAVILLAPLLWLIVLIALCYVILGEFPILYKQIRIGKNNKPFKMIKFRTLSTDERLSLTERSFALGKFLRFTSLDELPQLWNVLRGEMSLIGPRPLPQAYLGLYSNEQISRHQVRPGITGWAQVNGRNSVSWQKKFELDVYYVRHSSLQLDLIIVLKTLALIFSFKKDVSLREEKFTGN